VPRNTRTEGRLDTVLVVLCLVLGVLAYLSPRRTRDQVAGLLRASVLVPFVAIEGEAAAARSAITSRNAVLEARGRAVVDSLSVRALVDENAALRRLMGLSARLRDGFVAAELLPSRGGDPFTIDLTVGSDAGVEPFLPVVTADGLVGMVETVDANSSTALTWAHPDFRVSAMSVDQNAFGIVQPHLGAGAERWLLEMRGVPFRAKLDSGTLVVSSGLGATYPRGIPVGTVLGELTTPEKWARTYLLKPVVLPEGIGPVLVLLSTRTQRGVNGVWTSVAAADSAARAVAAAGDSLARKAALDELAARRAVLDSLRADSVAAGDTIGGGTVRVAPAPMSATDSAARADSLQRVRREAAARETARREAARRDSIRRADSIRARAVPPRTGPPPAAP
jgi:rod shape-determining protein MreC